MNTITRQDFQSFLDKQKILTARQAEVLSMYHVDVWTAKQIAAELNVSVGTIQHIVFYGENKLLKAGYCLPNRKEMRGRPRGAKNKPRIDDQSEIASEARQQEIVAVGAANEV